MPHVPPGTPMPKPDPLELLAEAHEHVCGALCPTVWQTNNPPPHSELCQKITRARGLERSPFPPHPKAA